MNTNAVNQVAENVSGYTESEKSSKVSGKTIGEPKLSDKAKEYYEKLKKKFSTMDFIIQGYERDSKSQCRTVCQCQQNGGSN